MAKNFVCDNSAAVVQTKAGKLKGFLLDGTYTFYGIKYANAKRFQEPTEVEPWDGIKNALAYGYVCPMLHQDVPGKEVMVPHRYWPLDENCQYLNVWTQSICPDAKKPVMVWMHGGGFAAGSGIEQVCYEGDSLSKFGDVVVVTLNHRLNILGYLDLSAFGEKYKNSGNAGNADLVAALKWVHENIAAFGGDPENVTIFGQSGGGMKVQCMLQTPSADGLFQKGIVMSGVADFPQPKVVNDGGVAIANALLKELGYEENDVEKLETVPYDLLAEAYNKVAPEVIKAGFYAGGSPVTNDFYAGDPRKGLTDHAKTIPLMVGSVIAEMAFGAGVDNKWDLSEEEMEAMIDNKFENAPALIAAFKKAYPNKNLTDLLFFDGFCRGPSKDLVRTKAASPEAPTYSYVFAYEFPFDGGKPAWHCSDLPFVFHNTKRVPICAIPGVSDRLEEQMAGAWVNFARYGNPNHPGIPQWNPSTPDEVNTMIFDTVCEAKTNFDDELTDLMSKAKIKNAGDNGAAMH